MSYIRYVVNHISTPRDVAGLQEAQKGRNKDSKSFAIFNAEQLASRTVLPAGDIPYFPPLSLNPPFMRPPSPDPPISVV